MRNQNIRRFLVILSHQENTKQSPVSYPMHPYRVVVRAKAASNGGYVSVFTVAKKPRKD